MTGISTIGQAMESIQRIKSQQIQFSEIALQISTGKKTQTFSGLGNDVLTSQRARTDISSIDTYTDNIKNADRRIKLMLNAVQEFKKQAENFHAALIGFNQQSAHQEGEPISYDDPLTLNVVETTQVGYTSDKPDVSLVNLQRMAQSIYGLAKDLINTKEGDRFLFGGAGTLTQPLTDTGTLEASVSSLISGWKGGTISTTNLIADMRDRTTSGGNLDAVTDTIIGYSPALSANDAGRVFVRVSQSTEVEYTALANDSAFSDIMVALSYFKNEDLGPIADAYIPPNTYPGVPDVQGAPGANVDEMKENFYAVFNDMTRMVSDAIDRIDTIGATLANAQLRITDVRNSQEQERNVLRSVVSDIEDVDLTEASVRIRALENQIQVSMAVTSRLQQLSLVNFLFQ